MIWKSQPSPATSESSSGESTRTGDVRKLVAGIIEGLREGARLRLAQSHRETWPVLGLIAKSPFVIQTARTVLPRMGDPVRLFMQAAKGYQCQGWIVHPRPDLPGFSGAGEGVRACSADSIATKVLGFQV